MSSVLSTAIDAARAQNADRITRITLVIGELSEVLPEAMEFAHLALSPGTIAEGSELLIKNVQARSRCLVCGHEYTHDQYRRSCPLCDALACELLAGRELHIESIEVEDADRD
ncbi:MAG: hydrogenase maturation nickel metallochaperone HypA [Coriobacteriia bacterium]|nr:hydrogenase maturation nickel metallochaperone HypA [Coriobacteriia bacterium]MCL2137080.1 hydrogenase maturation nickel metallochaperone HypA [Coriobacteriia bacterium]